MYREDIGAPQIKEKAGFWLKTAAEKGLGNARFDVGFMCQNGLCVLRSYEKAGSWYRKAAEQGNPNTK